MNDYTVPPTLAAIVPLYNKAGQIARAIHSIGSQSAPPTEVIIVNDGSTDDSASIAARLCDHYGFRLINQENRGEGGARNAGIDAASATYTCFLDADDEWLPNHVETLWEAINSSFQQDPQNMPALIGTQSRKSSEPRRPSREYPPDHSFYELLLAEWKNHPINSSTACARRSDLLSIGGFPLGARHGADQYVWFRLGMTGRTKLVPKVTAIIHDDDANRITAGPPTQVPYQISYFLGDKEGYSYTRTRKDLARLLQRSVFRNSIPLSIWTRPRIAAKYTAYAWKLGLLSGISVTLSVLFPASFKRRMATAIRSYVHATHGA